MQDHFKRFFVLCYSEMIFSILIEMLMPKAIEIEIAFFHSLGNPKGHTLDYFFYASHIRHNFLPYKLIPISMSYLKYFLSHHENSTSVFNYWDDFRTFTSILFSNLNVTWDRPVFVWKEKIRTIFKTNSILTWISNWLGVYANDGGSAVSQQHQTFKAVTDGKLNWP